MTSFSCLALIERETKLLYEEMVKKARDRNIELLLNVILQETKGHEEIFKHLARLCDQAYPPAISDCEKLMGTILTDSLRLTRNLKEDMQKGMPLSECVRRLVDYEAAVAEEYVTLIHSRISATYEEDASTRKVLEYIGKDEERHGEILKSIIQITSNKKNA
jgi:rubrerythrin